METRANKHVLVGGIEGVWHGDLRIADAATLQQVAEGMRFAVLMNAIRQDPKAVAGAIEEASREIRTALAAQRIDLHSLHVHALSYVDGRIIPTFAMEVTELDDGLMGSIETRSFQAIDPGPGNRDPWTGNPINLEAWIERQGMLRRRRAETGILMDPVLHAMLDQPERDALLKHLRGGGTRAWPENDLDERIDPRIRGRALKDGIVLAEIVLHDDARWNTVTSTGQDAVILLTRDIPESAVLAMAGRPLRNVIDHPLIDPDWIITEAGTRMIAPSRRQVLINTRCGYVPVSAAV